MCVVYTHLHMNFLPLALSSVSWSRSALHWMVDVSVLFCGFGSWLTVSKQSLLAASCLDSLSCIVSLSPARTDHCVCYFYGYDRWLCSFTNSYNCPSKLFSCRAFHDTFHSLAELLDRRMHNMLYGDNTNAVVYIKPHKRMSGQPWETEQNWIYNVHHYSRHYLTFRVFQADLSEGHLHSHFNKLHDGFCDKICKKDLRKEVWEWTLRQTLWWTLPTISARSLTSDKWYLGLDSHVLLVSVYKITNKPRLNVTSLTRKLLSRASSKLPCAL